MRPYLQFPYKCQVLDGFATLTFMIDLDNPLVSRTAASPATPLLKRRSANAMSADLSQT